ELGRGDTPIEPGFGRGHGPGAPDPLLDEFLDPRHADGDQCVFRGDEEPVDRDQHRNRKQADNDHRPPPDRAVEWVISQQWAGLFYSLSPRFGGRVGQSSSPSTLGNHLAPGGQYFFSQANTSLCQYSLFFGFKTQCPSSGKLMNRDGTCCLCSALNSS